MGGRGLPRARDAMPPPVGDVAARHLVVAIAILALTTSAQLTNDEASAFVADDVVPESLLLANPSHQADNAFMAGIDGMMGLKAPHVDHSAKLDGDVDTF